MIKVGFASHSVLLLHHTRLGLPKIQQAFNITKKDQGSHVSVSRYRLNGCFWVGRCEWDVPWAAPSMPLVNCSRMMENTKRKYKNVCISTDYNFRLKQRITKSRLWPVEIMRSLAPLSKVSIPFYSLFFGVWISSIQDIICNKLRKNNM